MTSAPPQFPDLPPFQPPPLSGRGWPPADSAARASWAPDGTDRGRHAASGSWEPGASATGTHPPPPQAADPQPRSGDALDDEAPDEDFLRPFVVTRGRSQPSVVGLRVETQLWTRPEALDRPLRFEAQRIVEACRTPRSIAEVAVRLGMPLGVVRILVADLVADQLLACEEPGRISIALLERIRERVLAL